MFPDFATSSPNSKRRKRSNASRKRTASSLPADKNDKNDAEKTGIAKTGTKQQKKLRKKT